MKIFEIRKTRKELKDVLHYAKHVRHMHEDIADPKALEQLQAHEKAAREARKGCEGALMETAGEAIIKACEKVAPPRRHPKVRENVEVLFVAVAAAMAIRAYFFQPFKIPTGSMQPTLYGITLRHETEADSKSLPAKVIGMVCRGEAFLEAVTPFDRIAKNLFIGSGYNVIAKADGRIPVKMTAHGVDLDYRDNFDGGKTITIYIGGQPHIISPAVAPYCRYGEEIRVGESILRGVVKAGDYILVNRFKYNFIRPKRGDIVVFDAQDVARNDYFIKRMVGLPGETISIDPPYLLVNGEKPVDPRFDKLFSNKKKYMGYIFAPQSHINKQGDSITLGNNEYLFFGDNTANSFDGRYFGSVKESRIIGSAFFVGLPFDRAGFADSKH